MKNLRLALLTVLVGVGVALTYFGFEAVVSHAINFVWEDIFDTDKHRLIVVPLCVTLTLVYFGAQHLFDRNAEDHQSHGLGSAPQPTLTNYVKVLALGFLSLLAGASLGPEAVLVPACIVLGSYIGTRFYKNSDASSKKLLTMLGFVALMAAFFNSFFVGLLSLLLIKKQFKADITPKLLGLAALVSLVVVAVLDVLDTSGYVATPAISWGLTISSALGLVLLVGAGYLMTYGISLAHQVSEVVIAPLRQRPWWFHALIAGSGLSLLYLIGGNLVEFTGNESIVPMLHRAAELGLAGLALIFVVKLAAIAWSNANGYRGGLIFPTVFASSVLVAIAQLYFHDLNFIYGLLCVLIGALVADSKAKVLL